MVRLDSTTIKSENGHYIVDMLWKDSSVQLPDNRLLAENRFHSLVRRFKRQPELHKKYSETIESYVQRGYARKMSEDEVRAVTKRTWYLPHHPVINPNKAKVRVVFDAASKYHGTSLNDTLVTGPELLNSLIGILLRFRSRPVALVADI